MYPSDDLKKLVVPVKSSSSTGPPINDGKQAETTDKKKLIKIWIKNILHKKYGFHYQIMLEN